MDLSEFDFFSTVPKEISQSVTPSDFFDFDNEISVSNDITISDSRSISPLPAPSNLIPSSSSSSSSPDQQHDNYDNRDNHNHHDNDLLTALNQNSPSESDRHHHANTFFDIASDLPTHESLTSETPSDPLALTPKEIIVTADASPPDLSLSAAVAHLPLEALRPADEGFETRSSGFDEEEMTEDISLNEPAEDETDPDAPPFDAVSALEDGADMMWSVLKPVMLTMFLVVVLVKYALVQTPETITAVMQYSENTSDDATTRFFGSMLNALIFVGVILVVTCIFVALFYFRCMKVLYGWLLLSSTILFFLVASGVTYMIMAAGNWTIDYLTFAFFIWNFAVVGLIAVFWHSPPMVTQAYMIVTSVLMAVTFSRLPEWTTWWVLAAIAIYDVFAVLCPKGPLNILVGLSQERNEEIPALLYSTAAFLLMTSSLQDLESEEEEEEEGNQGDERSRLVLEEDGNDSFDASDLMERDTTDEIDFIAPPSAKTSNKHAPIPQHESEEKRSVKLGLGDFVFYSVLVGRAALYDIVTVFTSFIGIVVGLVLTLICLSLFRRALPALPFSIGLGILFFFLTKWCLLPMVLFLSSYSIMI